MASRRITGYRIAALLTAASLVLLWSNVKLHGRLEDPEVDAVALRESFRRQPLQKRPPHTANSTFSACLLVMDDNHFLIEWLAFHFHVLPLRFLIVAVDPRSITFPNDILHRFRSHGMTILQWEDGDFMSKEEQQKAEYYVERYFGSDIGQNLIKHRARQRMFYYKCMRKLKEEGRDWTLLTDSDEFLFINYNTTTALNLNKNAPEITRSGSVMSLLQNELQRPGHNLSTPCVQIPRIRFGARESESTHLLKAVPTDFNASTFQTLRWRKHAASNNYVMNRISKVMVDLSRVSFADLMPVDSIHRPIRSICSQRRLHIRSQDQIFKINHYLGTVEQYSYRDDSRTGKERSLAKYRKTARVEQETDDSIRPWLEGFVRDQGLDTAKSLLKGVGDLEPKKKKKRKQ